MKNLLCSIFLLISNIILSQENNLKCQAYYQSSDNRPVVGLGIKEDNSNKVYTDNKGVAYLSIVRKEKGQALQISISEILNDGTGKQIEVVNEKEVKSARLPYSMSDALEIIICPKGQREIAAEDYYNILSRRKRLKQEALLKEQKEQLDASLNVIETLNNENDILNRKLDSSLVRQNAIFLANLNTDKVDENVKLLIHALKNDSIYINIDSLINEIDNTYENANNAKKANDITIKKAIEGQKVAAIENINRLRYEEAINRYDRVITIFNEQKYDEIELSIYMLEKSTILNILGLYDKAFEIQQQVLNIRKSKLDTNDIYLADTYKHLTETYLYKGDYESALEMSKKALYIRKLKLDSLNMPLAEAYNNVAASYSRLSQYDSALIFQLKDKDIIEKITDANKLDIAITYNNLGDIYTNLRNYDTALFFLNKALKLKEKILNPNDPFLCVTYSNISAVYREKNLLDSALIFNEKEIRIIKKSLRKNHPNLIESLYSRGIILSRMKLYESAQENYFQALQISPTTDTLTLMRSDLYNNIATNYFRKQKLDSAIYYNKKAIEIREKLRPNSTPRLYASYKAMVGYYVTIKDFSSAIEYQNKYTNLLKNEEKIDSLELSISYNTIAQLFQRLKNYKESLTYNKKALEIRENILQATDKLLAESYNNIGVNFAKLLKFKESKKYLSKYESIGNDNGRANRNWVIYYCMKKKKKLAIQSLKKAVEFGYSDFEWLNNDDSIIFLKDEKEYIEIIKILRKKTK